MMLGVCWCDLSVTYDEVDEVFFVSLVLILHSMYKVSFLVLLASRSKPSLWGGDDVVPLPFDFCKSS